MAGRCFQRNRLILNIAYGLGICCVVFLAVWVYLMVKLKTTPHSTIFTNTNTNIICNEDAGMAAMKRLNDELKTRVRKFAPSPKANVTFVSE